MYYNPLSSYLISEERPKVVSPTAISVSDSIFQELQNFINLNEEPISV